MTVHVTLDHILRGRRGKHCECPIALALRELTGDQWFVLYPYAVDGKQNTHWLPREAKDFIYFFDGGAKVKPISFELEVEP